MRLRHILVMLLLITLCSCDGFARSIHPYGTGMRPTAQALHEKQTMTHVLNRVVAQGGYEQRGVNENEERRCIAYYSKPQNGNWLGVQLVQDKQTGACSYVIIDWPRFTRSRASHELEAELRARINAMEIK